MLVVVGSVVYTEIYRAVNSPALLPIENLLEIVMKKMRNTKPTNTSEMKVKTTWALRTPQQIASMPHHTDVVICGKRAPTKYRVYKGTYV